AEKKLTDNALGVMTIVEYQQDRDGLQKLLADPACVGECRSDAMSSLKKVSDILTWDKMQNHNKPLFEAVDDINTIAAVADAPATLQSIFKLGVRGLTKAGVLEDIAVDAGKTLQATEKSDAALGACMTPGSCFVAGTLVMTDKGLKAIETFVGGELVWSRSDQTGEYGFQPVVAHKATQDQDIYRVEVINEDGLRETFRTTAEHPFWIKDQGWLKASLLQAGMLLVSHAGLPLIVVSQDLEAVAETVFNIQVAEFETYHVGELGAWVHNAKCCPDLSNMVQQSEEVASTTQQRPVIKQLANLFSSNVPGRITIGSSTFTELPKSGNAAIFSGASEMQIQKYFMELTGSSSLPKPIPLSIREISGVRYTVSTPSGNFTLRNVSASQSQTGPAWTIDVPGSAIGTTYNKEIKFLIGK
uniref:polymorphic toxin-type HINT domain-containing protein n=1 Tax=Chromobacterium subtsugae TaxID=251747 RepID=UPI000AC7C82A